MFYIGLPVHSKTANISHKWVHLNAYYSADTFGMKYNVIHPLQQRPHVLAWAKRTILSDAVVLPNMYYKHIICYFGLTERRMY